MSISAHQPVTMKINHAIQVKDGIRKPAENQTRCWQPEEAQSVKVEQSNENVQDNASGMHRSCERQQLDDDHRARVLPMEIKHAVKVTDIDRKYAENQRQCLEPENAQNVKVEESNELVQDNANDVHRSCKRQRFDEGCSSLQRKYNLLAIKRMDIAFVEAIRRFEEAKPAKLQGSRRVWLGGMCGALE